VSGKERCRQHITRYSPPAVRCPCR
jgi:hypothetical protein